uniref:Uncharacterized protein n=1 Tax=Romanomermis culicivorax TaxID=13658 RepID=A0A915KC80_ROMCU
MHKSSDYLMNAFLDLCEFITPEPTSIPSNYQEVRRILNSKHHSTAHLTKIFYYCVCCNSSRDEEKCGQCQQTNSSYCYFDADNQIKDTNQESRYYFKQTAIFLGHEKTLRDINKLIFSIKK